jgi:hypothetical protein
MGISNMPPDSMLSSLKDLANTVEKLWDKYGPLSIHSAYRSPEVNKAVGGSPTSKHMAGNALDFTPVGMSITDLWLNLISDPLANQLGEISLKPDQNSIHITLPYWSSSEYVKNSPRVKEGSGYYRITSDVAKNALAKLGINLTEEEMKTAMTVGGVGLVVLTLGAGAFALALALKAKKS